MLRHSLRRLIFKQAELRWSLRGALAGAWTSAEAPIIVGGCPRSGTTLLRTLLDTHRNICCGPESYLFTQRKIKIERLAHRFELPEREVAGFLKQARTRAEFIESFFRDYCQRKGKRRWAEKTPKNVREFAAIAKNFPQACFVHVIRDPRDAVCSLRTHPRYKLKDGQLVERGTRRPIPNCARMWVRDVSAGLAYRGQPHYAEVRYEDIVLRTRPALEKLFHDIGEEFDPRVMEHFAVEAPSRDVTRNVQNPTISQPIFHTSIGRWRQDLSPEELQSVLEQCGALMRDTGYEV